MLRSPLARAVLLALSAALASCASGDAGGDGGVVGAPTNDAGSDAGVASDGGAALDGGSAANLDGGAVDAGSDADAGSDGGDVNPDGGGADAGSEAGSDAGAGGLDAGAPGFGGGFAPDGGSGGFGGGSCTASKTPIVFFHGSGDDSTVWSRPASTGGPSVLAALAAAGYRDCELYGLTWLTPTEQLTPELIFHDAARAELVRGFLDQVRAYTGKAQVDLVAHSMGATLALHALEGAGQNAGVRRFVSISGGLRGLPSCTVVGPADPLALTCGAQSIFDSDTFGFYPTSNPRMEEGGFRSRPGTSGASYYSIRAGLSDEVLCAVSTVGCDSALFDSAANVLAQLDVGEGTPTVALGDDDSSGVGHFRARSNAGPLLVNFLTGSCAGAACCVGIAGPCAP